MPQKNAPWAPQALKREAKLENLFAGLKALRHPKSASGALFSQPVKLRFTQILDCCTH
jgi:hypothetical protein